MKTLKNITYTLVTLSLITFLAATNSFAGTNASKSDMNDEFNVCLTSGVPAEIDSRYLNGK